MNSLIDLFIYPIKGLTGQRVQRIQVTERGFPFDRLIALARRNGSYGSVVDSPLTLESFFELYALDTHARLAGVVTEFDPVTEHFVVKVQGHSILECHLDSDSGVEDAIAVFANVLDVEPADRPVLVRAAPQYNYGWPGLEDTRNMWACHLVNLASVRDLEAQSGRRVDPRRFRANMYVELHEPWVERNWVGRRFTIGEVEFECIQSSTRCAATEVNPDNAIRDIPIPRLLKQHYGHTEMGIYANVVTAGSLTSGMELRCEPTAALGLDVN
ncbi:MOSC domain-containing protein [Mycolicibacterium tokaiense]|uniref:MOSC domain-containing protein n=1 Tax=Mycolicibacterium tokaiense TaxID=39695 RepID=UPI0013D5EA02|nr:MOSC domain-containing protein [Mycolicibacterium tokaiense]